MIPVRKELNLSHRHKPDELTGFSKLRSYLKRKGEVYDEDPSLSRFKLKGCKLQDCQGNCCHDGAVLRKDEVETLLKVIEENSEFFKLYNIDKEDMPFVRGADGEWQTQTVESDHYEACSEFSQSFQQTRCRFLTNDSKCMFQILADKNGRHSWYWKPLACWLHPLVLNPVGGDVNVTLGSDPHVGHDDEVVAFVSETSCGNQCSKGMRAKELLAKELLYLNELTGRK